MIILLCLYTVTEAIDLFRFSCRRENPEEERMPLQALEHFFPLPIAKGRFPEAEL